MNNNISYRGLIHHAQLGNQESMKHLVELVKERLFAHIYRLTLNYDLAEDLLQETLMEMVKSLKDLEHVDRFWYWLFRTALGKVQHHFRREKRKRMIEMSALDKERLLERTSGSYDDGLDKMVRRELSGAIFEAMQRLKIKHRSVLALRCFEQMPYSEIAVIMDCSELRARVLFFRAKDALRRQLAQHGFSKKFLLAGLALFGLLTTSAKAASVTSTVTAGSVEVGFAATLVGVLASRAGVALVTAMAAVTAVWGVKTLLCVVSIACFTLFCLLLFYLASIYTS